MIDFSFPPTVLKHSWAQPGDSRGLSHHGKGGHWAPVSRGARNTVATILEGTQAPLLLTTPFEQWLLALCRSGRGLLGPQPMVAGQVCSWG